MPAIIAAADSVGVCALAGCSKAAPLSVGPHATHPSAEFESMTIAQLPRGIMSLSLGSSELHAIESKIAACTAQGWQGVEIHIDDVKSTARRLGGCDDGEQPSHALILMAAQHISQLCRRARLRVICLEPILHYPGMQPLSRRDAWLSEELPLWLKVSDLLDTDIIQVASAMFSTDAQGEQRAIEDLRLLALAGQRWSQTSAGGRVKFFAYEAMCFGAHVTTWQQAWQQVREVNEHNFGMVLDTFQIVAGAVADPSQPGGLVHDWQAKLTADICELMSSFAGPQNGDNRRKLFFCQLGDASMPVEPITEHSAIFQPHQHGE